MMNETDIDQALGLLPRRIEPQRDLWPGISEQLDAGKAHNELPATKSFWHAPAIAATVFLALATGIIIGRGVDEPPQARMSILEYSLAGTLEASEREYQAAFAELVPTDYSGMQLAGDDPQPVRNSWDDLQKVEAALLAALREYPADIFLNEKLLDLRAQQLRFVKHMVLLEQNNWRRT